jgi:hypothetical protein
MTIGKKKKPGNTNKVAMSESDSEIPAKAGVKSRDAKEDVKQETKQGSSAVNEKAGTCVCVCESRNV